MLYSCLHICKAPSYVPSIKSKLKLNVYWILQVSVSATNSYSHLASLGSGAMAPRSNVGAEMTYQQVVDTMHQYEFQSSDEERPKSPVCVFSSLTLVHRWVQELFSPNCSFLGHCLSFYWHLNLFYLQLSGSLAPEEEKKKNPDGTFAFRRKPGCKYNAVKICPGLYDVDFEFFWVVLVKFVSWKYSTESTFSLFCVLDPSQPLDDLSGDHWPWMTDERHRYSLTTLAVPEKCMGFCRRRLVWIYFITAGNSPLDTEVMIWNNSS